MTILKSMELVVTQDGDVITVTKRPHFLLLMGTGGVLVYSLMQFLLFPLLDQNVESLAWTLIHWLFQLLPVLSVLCFVLATFQMFSAKLVIDGIRKIIRKGNKVIDFSACDEIVLDKKTIDIHNSAFMKKANKITDPIEDRIYGKDRYKLSDRAPIETWNINTLVNGKIIYLVSGHSEEYLPELRKIKGEIDRIFSKEGL